QNLNRQATSENVSVSTCNSLIDTLLFASSNVDVSFDDPRLEALQQKRAVGDTGKIILVTAHRRENLGTAMEEIGNAVSDLAHRYPELTVVFPIYKNPKVRSEERRVGK